MKAIHTLSRPLHDIITLGFWAFSAIYVHAYTFENPIEADDFSTVVTELAYLMKIIGIPLATAALVYSGFLFVTARGNEEQLKKAKKWFVWTVVGTAIIVGAVVIASAVVNFAQSLI